jgi:hypothetical protein
MTILEGKIYYQPTWNLEMVLRPGFTVDYTTRYSASESTKYLNCDFPYKNLEVTVAYNKNCLLQQQILNFDPIILNQNFKDTMEFADQELVVSLCGADINNNFLVDNQTITLGISIERLAIEGIDLKWYLDNNDCFLTSTGSHKRGTTFLAENGQQKINLQTPIYSWLINHEHYIIKQFCQKN